MSEILKPKLFSWTFHAKAKMQFYRLSPSRVRRVLNAPKRTEEGVAPKTIAAMQPGALRAGKWNQEIWVMFQDSRRERKIISAWRYPGVTKPRDPVQRNFMKQEYDEYASGTRP